MSNGELITAAKDVILAIAAIVTATVAVVGLKTWKRQLKGTTEYELAKRILVSVYKVTAAIETARWPSVLPSEYIERPDRNSASTVPDHSDLEHVYEGRVSKIEPEFAELRFGLMEAEALWGDALRPAADQLWSLIRQLQYHVQSHLRGLRDERYWQALPVEDRQRTQEAVYAGLSTGGQLGQDWFAIAVWKAVSDFETKLRPRLEQRKR